MYLSRLMLNPRDPSALRAVSDSYALHQLVWSAFPGREDGGPGRVLFRAEEHSRGSAPTVLVQSDREPMWERIERSGLLTADRKRVCVTVTEGQRLRFRLRANPTVRRVFERGADGKCESEGKRIGVYGEDAQGKWLEAKAEKAGFRVLDCRVADRGVLVSRKPGCEQPIRHLCVDFDGILEVTDPSCFLAALESGIGSAKAFGFGLLSVAPA